MNSETAKQIAEARARFGPGGSARQAGGHSEPAKGRRTAGSVRFDPYWKVQWNDERSLTWRDIQQAHHNADRAVQAAQAHADTTRTTTRLMRITEKGRDPEPERYEPYCQTHDIYGCPFAHDPRRIT